MILIHPFSKILRNGQENPKNYPYWDKLIPQIKEPIVQVGMDGDRQLVSDFRKNLPLKSLAELVVQCRTWIAVDSFFQHFCWDLKKPGIVLWGQSDPIIFGHAENINLLKDRKYLRQNQFYIWEQAEYNADAFVQPEEVIKYLRILLKASDYLFK